ncbi:MAG: hypothetical protein GF330_09500 [Candidatus Eisenbacteria bacterium]|nr:hypothetical protein [Candidatus Eisenbacteria bacterium]
MAGRILRPDRPARLARALPWSPNHHGSGTPGRIAPGMGRRRLAMAGGDGMEEKMRLGSHRTIVWLGALLACCAACASASAGPEQIALTEAGRAGARAPLTRVLESSEDGLRLEFELPALRVAEVEIEGETYHLLAIEEGAVSGREGEPMLPTYSRLIQVPDRAGFRYEITAVETSELAGYRPIPMQPEDAEAFLIDETAYQHAGFLGGERARLGEPALARALRVVPISFHPVRYDPARDLLEVATRIEVQVRFDGLDLRNAPSREHRIVPRSFDQLYRQLVINYDGPREGQTLGLGTYVIICPNNSTVLDRLEPLVEWRTRKGWDVYLATTSETGSSREQIKDWLEDAYATWENPPEHVALIGDTGGTISIPCWYYGSGNTDHDYTQLDGTDLLPEVHLGRISVDSYDRLSLYVNKIVGYESTPYMDETDWYEGACLVGDRSHSGISCIQIMQWLKERLVDLGYTGVDTIFTGPFTTGMRNSLNDGVSVFSYRGYWGHSGWGTGDIYALNNGRKMPYALSITCGTGDFDGSTSYSEAWIRAGSPPSSPDGAIASVATATLGTHTRYNNCVTYGAWRSIFWEEGYTFGESFTRAKLELYVNYYEGDQSGCATFIHWNNLMGDPAGEMWTGVPQPMSVSHPTTLALGSNAVTTTVTVGGFPLEGATVCLWKEGETHVVGETGADGSVELPIEVASAGDLRITVTAHDHQPHLDTIAIGQQDHFVAYSAHSIDDDGSGSSSGNGDGQPNPTEAIELRVQVQNFGTQGASDVTGTLTTDDPYVTILDDSESFGDIAAGGSAWSADDFDIEIAAGAPSGHVIDLGLDLQAGGDDWHSLIQIPVVAAALAYNDLTLYDMGTQVDPGDAGEISVELLNFGDATGQDIVGNLVSRSSWVTVTDYYGTFGDIAPGGTGENGGNRFGISAASDALPGHLAELSIELQFSDGMRDTASFLLQVGSASSSDPTGPDGYGYVAFDNTDTSYPDAPTYDWVELEPGEGGPGIDLGLTDFGGDDDDSRMIDLPFTFQYYGEEFDRVTICSNGWVAMGWTDLENRRNWNIPGAGAPAYMIAPMWDNLYQDGSNKVYYWYDEAGHRFLIQWADLRNNQGGDRENFELILLDPAHHPTATGDGEIVFQYETFNNSDYLQQYSTVGIQNEDRSDGVCYSYFNRYTAGSATIQSGRAIKFTPLSAVPRGTLNGTVTNASNGGTPVPGATIELLENGQTFVTGADGAYGGAVEVGTYTVTVSHASFAPDTTESVWIVEGEVTEVDFSLDDIAPPAFSGTTVLPNTSDTAGPYVISSTVIEYSDLTTIALRYNVNGSGWNDVPMSDAGDDLYTAEIPGQAQGSLIKYYLTAEDVVGLEASDPAEAPWETYEFWVLAPLFVDDMESGAGDWTSYVVTGGYENQWHRSEQRNHTAGGAWSWKFGDSGGGEYIDMSDGALESAPVTLEGDARLFLWHWIDSEVSGSYPGYAYDGGLVEMSVNGGGWAQITPVGGYPYLIREGSGPGPFPAETPVFAGSQSWTREEFDLSGVTGSVRFRFRFGSDGSVGAEGWYIDDVEVIPGGPGQADAEELELLPAVTALHQNRPNPVGGRTGGTLIRFDLPRSSDVQLVLYDVGGRRVRELASGTWAAGRHQVAWNGCDPHGRRVECGVYFYVLETDRERIARRMLVVQ